MRDCFFVSDLHGKIERYNKLFEVIEKEKPEGVFLGGDLLPSGLLSAGKIDIKHRDFINDFLVRALEKLRDTLKKDYPRIFIILGNDDGRFPEASLLDSAAKGIWEYIQERKVALRDFCVYGYSYVPPTPFMLKDWERYDVSRYVDPGCISPEEGWRSVPVSEYEMRYRTIKKDLADLAGEDKLDKSIFLFHAPPYKTALDRAALDNVKIDGVPVDVHTGSIAIKNFIEDRQPLITLHGHIHESAKITGKWYEQTGRTYSFSAAHDGPELSLVNFNPEEPEKAERRLI